MKRHSAKTGGITPVYVTKTQGTPKQSTVNLAKNRLNVTTPSEIDYFGDNLSQEQYPHGQVESGQYNKTTPNK